MKVTRSVFLMFAFVSGLIATTGAQVRPVQDNNPRFMTFKNADFEIVLGPNWKHRDTEGTFEWEDDKDLQEIVISVFTTNEVMDTSDTAKRLMEHRKKAIYDISEGKAVLTDVEKVENKQGTELIVWGIDKIYGMQVYTSVIVHPKRAVTVAYYKYSPLMKDSAFRTKSQEIRAALKVH